MPKTIKTMKNKQMLVYLADLAHDYLPARQFVPLGIGYIASYATTEFHAAFPE